MPLYLGCKLFGHRVVEVWADCCPDDHDPILIGFRCTRCWNHMPAPVSIEKEINS